MMVHEATVESLKEVFEDWSKCLNEGRLDEFFAYFHEDSDTLDEDYPWRMTKEEFIDHIDYHASSNDGKGLWEFFQWIPRECNFVVVGMTGHTAGFSTFRGITPCWRRARMRIWCNRWPTTWLALTRLSPVMGCITTPGAARKGS